jgi:CheY-like chemotaxis protein
LIAIQTAVRLAPRLKGTDVVPFPKPATTILVVDDEPLSRRVAYRLLSEEGYRVLEAESCAETLDVLRLAQGRVDLVVIDVVMPHADGVAIGRKVVEQWPDMRILYMSAHPAEVLARHGLTALNVPFLAKPYTRGEALEKVRVALERRQTPRAGVAKGDGRSILLVDDDLDVRHSLRRVLERAGHIVTEAGNGQEAVKLWRRHPGDLVILDMFMPEKDGLETIVELRAHNPNVRIIAMSGGGAKNRLDILDDARLLGADLAIQKPFHPAELLKLVELVFSYSD